MDRSRVERFERFSRLPVDLGGPLSEGTIRCEPPVGPQPLVGEWDIPRVVLELFELRHQADGRPGHEIPLDAHFDPGAAGVAATDQGEPTPGD